ncbi:hypothetical protein [uncultured Nostoc sp.]|uniref:hypothetical protein n=1 Tax=uncultured Nostoc sp. TaxID=340711 RepID=UPI0035CA93BF
MNSLQSAKPPKLSSCNSQVILNYFENAWQLEDMLLKSLLGEDTLDISENYQSFAVASL